MAQRFTDRLAYLQSERTSEEKSGDYFDNILTNIERYGLSIVHVCPREDEEGLNYSYSIGLYDTFGQPEVLVSGFPIKLAHSVLNHLAERCAEGLIAQPDIRYGDFLGGGADVIFRPMLSRFVKPTMLSCAWFYGKDFRFPAYQCICPDLNNVFPWEDGFDSSWRSRQALLYEGAEITPVEEELLG
ncbi:MAG: DUF4262 domain-containing protein [Acidobacteriaceae bacterium]|nr:DUF4262 domain-containing protein [Acidobacteriaceae bacterium]